MVRVHDPVSTYRVQLGGDVTFEVLSLLVPYLSALGITDVYTSPILKPRPGSSHGYDICDHGALNPALGSLADFETLASALQSHGLGLVVDFVPNHMALHHSNRWWRDVLTHGRASRYAAYFDIDWDPVSPELRNRILLPILETGYGEVLHRGGLALAFDRGALELHYHDWRLPIEPASSARWLRAVARRFARSASRHSDVLKRLRGCTSRLDEMPGTLTMSERSSRQRAAMADAVRKSLASLARRSAPLRQAMDAELASWNGTPHEPSSFDAIHGLIDSQVYRLSHWRTALDEINYRRFFDVNDLGAIRMEHPPVFTAAHKFTLELVRRGAITGLRLDHLDGLFDPSAYLTALRRAASNGGDRRPYVVGEKILGEREALPEDWDIDGTTGYTFLNAVNGLFVDGSNARTIERMYRRFTGRADSFHDTARLCKRSAASASMASELAVLARSLKRLAARSRITRDFTLNGLRQALVELVAAFPVYRSYVTARGSSAADREAIDFAVDRARQRTRVLDASIFLFIRNVLLSGATESDFPMKFQQFTAPVHAKGIEDTSFYRHCALLSLNEVGGNPGQPGVTVEAFHEGNRDRVERYPRELTATSTHDTKRAEDARARITVLSEVPVEWRHALLRWHGINLPRKTAVDREPAPDLNDEYLFYQSLIGAWPAEPLDAPIPSEAPPEFVDRMRGFMQKAVREAKVHTSWTSQHKAYEDAVDWFVQTSLSGPAAHPFLAAVVPFIRRLAIPGVVNALSQLVLKIGSPGVPDFYQGAEAWLLHLADPDNRRPVDFEALERRLCGLSRLIQQVEASDDSAAAESCVGALLASWPDARIKTFLMATGLRLRRREARLFVDGAYEPITASGDAASRIVAFKRTVGDKAVTVAAPRLTARGSSAGGFPLAGAAWGEARLAAGLAPARQVRHVFTGAPVPVSADGSVSLAEVFRTLPVAILIGA